jgi:hypothetical protein
MDGRKERGNEGIEEIRNQRLLKYHTCLTVMLLMLYILPGSR